MSAQEYLKLNNRLRFVGIGIVALGVVALDRLVIPAFKEKFLVPLGFVEKKAPKDSSGLQPLTFPEPEQMGDFKSSSSSDSTH